VAPIVRLLLKKYKRWHAENVTATEGVTAIEEVTRLSQRVTAIEGVTRLSQRVTATEEVAATTYKQPLR
jgi:hypothetical protein